MGLFLSLWSHTRTPDVTPISPTFPSMVFPTSSRLALILTSKPVLPGDGRSHWSSLHCSPHFLLSPCKQEVIRSPVELSSDGVRAKEGVKTGLHVWELVWSPKLRGSHAVIGISKQECPLQVLGYNALVGADSQSWGWDIKSHQLWHDGKTLGCYPGKIFQSVTSEKSRPSTSSNVMEEGSPWLIPEHVLLVLDADARTLGFVVDGNFLGMAFKDLPRGVELFPAVSSVRGGARIRLRYLNGSASAPPPLMVLCGLSIRTVLGQQRRKLLNKLPLPPYLHQYLLHSF